MFNKHFKNDKGIMETQHVNLVLSKCIENLPEYYESKTKKVKLDSEEAYDKFVDYAFIQGTEHSIAVKL